MPHALLLSPDDQAVSAITGVLEEMSVTCERPLDGVSAAQKLNAQSFDLVLVDCENLPAAKLIFDVCRRGKNGNNPVPIAIVDGRAGLPTAFRLGAELILTKPVAKDQARSTIRTAVSRVRKDVPAAAQSASTSVSAAIMTAVIPEDRALAAAASGDSSQLTSYAEPAPSFVLSASPVSTSAVSTTSASTSMSSATSLAVDVDEVSASSASPALESKPVHSFAPSDDPVLAELERTELEEKERAEHKPDLHESSELETAALDEPAAESSAPESSSYREPRPRTRGSLIALLMLALASAGFYAAWTYQPGFREIAQPQIDRMLALVGMAPPPAAAPTQAKPATHLAPATTPAPAAPNTPNQPPSTAPAPTTSSAGSVPTSSPATTSTTTPAPAAVQPPATPVAAVTPPAAATAALPITGKSDTAKPAESKPVTIAPSNGKKDAVSSDDQPVDNGSGSVILSSKGAEKRLEHSVPPKYPSGATTEGTVVLKAVVDENGKVADLQLVEGNATLATAAMQAVKQWHYRPYVRDGKTQSFQTVVIVDFQKP